MKALERAAAISRALARPWDHIFHVYPLFGRAHVCSEDCWCEPQPDPVEPSVLVHRASE